MLMSTDLAINRQWDQLIRKYNIGGDSHSKEMDSAPFRQPHFDDGFPHFEERTSIFKTLILQSNCHPATQYQVHIPYHSITRQLDLGCTLNSILKKIIPASHSYQVFYYCTDSEYFVFAGMYPFQDYLLIGQNFVAQPVISVKINRIHPPLAEQPEIVAKKKRIHDRTIREVLEKVAEWRSISKQKSVTLEEASKELNMPKKTLDDYFFQIKQGQYYGFDFEAHQDRKIGVLRKFVKENHKKKQEEPVKILEHFMGKEVLGPAGNNQAPDDDDYDSEQEEEQEEEEEEEEEQQ